MANEKSLTLRQIEVLRAVMVAGSIAGAARILNVAQPGISRTMKHLETSLGIRLFTRSGGRYVPTPESQQVFLQLQEVHKKLLHLQVSIGQMERGHDVEISLASVPSIANVMVPRAAAGLKARFPDIRMNIEILKIEEAIDFLLLGKGQFVCMSHRFEHPSIVFEHLAVGNLVCVAHRDHPLARLERVTAGDIAAFPLIGIDPADPYGAILAEIFARQGLDFRIEIRARFGTTVLGLVRQNLGVAVLDNFTVAELHGPDRDIRLVPIAEKTPFRTYVARRSDLEISGFAEAFIGLLRGEMDAVTRRGIS